MFKGLRLAFCRRSRSHCGNAYVAAHKEGHTTATQSNFYTFALYVNVLPRAKLESDVEKNMIVDARW